MHNLLQCYAQPEICTLSNSGERKASPSWEKNFIAEPSLLQLLVRQRFQTWVLQLDARNQEILRNINIIAQSDSNVLSIQTQ